MNARRRLVRWALVFLVVTVMGLFPSPCSPLGEVSDRTAQAAALQTAEDVVINPSATWQVNVKERVSACDNRPGLKKIYVTVLDEWGNPLRGVVVRFDTEACEGIAFDHPSVWGYTNERGYIEWDHLGVPTRYVLFMGDDAIPLIENIRTDLGNEYCKPPGASAWSGNVPVNRPGIYSYRFEIQLIGQ